MTKTYDNNSIQSLRPVDAIRLRPGVMLGSADINGCLHAVFEILSNSVDEARAGYGKEIYFTIHQDQSITIEDFGRGVPLDFNEAENEYNYALVYTSLYAGGKFTNNNYDYSLGLNGLGAMACQCSSAWFDVESRRDGKIYTMHFEKGEPVGELSVKKDKTKPQITGTIQTWLPDLEVFTEIEISKEDIEEILKTQAVVNAGLRFIFTDERDNTKEEFCYPEGIMGYVNEIAGLDAMTEPYFFEKEGRGRDREDKDEYSVKAEVAFCFSNKNQALKYFHNSSPLEYGGSPDKAVKTAMVSAFDKEIKARGKYTAKEQKITFPDIQDSLILVVNSFSTQTSYENQTKKAINNKFIQTFLTDMIKDQMEIWFIEHKKDADKVIDQVLINKRSRETSETQRIAVKKKLMEKTDVTNKVKKFVDCRSKDPAERELFICLKGDTRVKLLDGTAPTIESIVGQTDLWGYSTDEIGRMVPAKITNVFQTREVTETLKLTFDDGSYVECTPKHRFLDKDTYTWVEAKDLQTEQALASLKFKADEVQCDQLHITDIKSVHYEEPIPVYCLTIDSDFHSFVLDNGIITHNCEGDSAMGALLTARDANTQALMPIRGKILNIEKASAQQIFGSDVIMDLIRVLGCGIEMRGKKLPKDIPPFDIQKLKFNKVIIIADQDVDGAHIVTLVTTMIHRLCPQLIEEGKFYVAQTPLFEITDRSGKKEETLYAFSDAERDALIKGKDQKKLTIQRAKGLGENNSATMSKFLALGTRKLIRVKAVDADEMEKWFDLFMGNDVVPRKKYIEEHGHEYWNDLDLS